MPDGRRTRVATSWPLTMLLAAAACVQAESHAIEANSFGHHRGLSIDDQLQGQPSPRTEPTAAATKPIDPVDPPSDRPTAAAATVEEPRVDVAVTDASLRRTDPRRLEATLRQRLAQAAEPADTAIELAGLLTELERQPEALQIVDGAIARQPTLLLRVTRAGLLRDLGRRDEAVTQLRALVREVGAEQLGAGVLFELAELEWLQRHADEAAAALETLRKSHPDDAWRRDNQDELKLLAAEIGRRRGPEQIKVRDLLGDLRGAAQVTVRQATLVRLLVIADQEGADGRPLHLQAVAIATADSSPAVRALAVQRAKPAADDIGDFCRLALDDADALVRRFAAARVPELMGEKGTAPLLTRLAAETDPAAFVAMHDALTTLHPGVPAIRERDAAIPERRQQIVAQWRERCPQ